MDDPSQLSYSVTPLRWYQWRRVQRWLMGVAVGVVGFALYQWLWPIWERYRYYRSEQAAAVAWAPVGEAVRFSTTQPYAHTPTALEIRDASFWAARRSLVSSFTVSGPRTEIFSGVLTTATGRRRLVQTYAMPTTTSTGIGLVAVSMELRDGYWVVHGSPSAWPAEDVWFGSLGLIPRKFRDVAVYGGTLNPGDPSEVDVRMILNGDTMDIPLHVVEQAGRKSTGTGKVSRGGTVVMAAQLDNLLKHFSGSGSWGFYKWPYDGKP